jgi:YD repeat-containing protein
MRFYCSTGEINQAMQKRILFSAALSSLLLLACAGNESAGEDQNSDSVVADTIASATTVREVQTDSGKLVITSRVGQELDDAVLLDASGKIIGKGQLYGNKPTGAWLKYDADGNVISAIHYAGETTYQLDETDFKTERVHLEKMGISFVKPVSWDTVSPFNPLTFASYEKKISDAGVFMRPNINISKGTLEMGQTLESLAADMLNMRHNMASRVDPVDEAYLTIDSCRAFRRYGMYYTEEGAVGFLDAIVVKGTTLYVISCAAQNNAQGEFLKYQAVFEVLVLSMQVH